MCWKVKLIVTVLVSFFEFLLRVRMTLLQILLRIDNEPLWRYRADKPNSRARVIDLADHEINESEDECGSEHDERPHKTARIIHAHERNEDREGNHSHHHMSEGRQSFVAQLHEGAHVTPLHSKAYGFVFTPRSVEKSASEDGPGESENRDDSGDHDGLHLLVNVDSLEVQKLVPDHHGNCRAEVRIEQEPNNLDSKLHPLLHSLSELVEVASPSEQLHLGHLNTPPVGVLDFETEKHLLFLL